MLELLEKYPKTTVVVKQWMLDKMLNSLKNKEISEEWREGFKDAVISDEQILIIIDSNPRTLFDIFDEHKINIEIRVDFKDPNKAKFCYSFDGGQNNSDLFYTRKEADRESIIKAFELLNNKL